MPCCLITRINAEILPIGPLRRNIRNISVKIDIFSQGNASEKSAKWRPFCLGINVLIKQEIASHAISRNHIHRSLLNSLAPGKLEWNFRYVIFKQILAIDGWGISCEIALIWMSMDFTDDQSTLVHVMAWCRQATSHYLSQCWLSFLSPYGVTRP